MIAVNAAISHVSFAWLVATQHYKDRMLENGLWAVGALAVGVGVFPMIAGLAALVRPRGEEWTQERRAVVATMGSLIVGFGWYTAVKAAYISTTFSTLVVERNLIYVAPLLFVGTAMFFERPAHALVGGRRRGRADAVGAAARLPVQDGRAHLLGRAGLLAASGGEPDVLVDAGPRAQRADRASSCCPCS